MKNTLKIADKLLAIQTKLKADKSRTNKFAGYKYRSAEDVLEALKPYLIEYNCSVIINEELISTDPIPIMKSIATIMDVKNIKDTISAVALVGVDLTTKGQQHPQRFGAASSYGKKYALGNLFLIDETQDADATNTHDKKPKFTKSHPKFQETITWLTKGDIKTNGNNLSKLGLKYEIHKDLFEELNILISNKDYE